MTTCCVSWKKSSHKPQNITDFTILVLSSPWLISHFWMISYCFMSFLISCFILMYITFSESCEVSFQKCAFSETWSQRFRCSSWLNQWKPSSQYRVEGKCPKPHCSQWDKTPRSASICLSLSSFSFQQQSCSSLYYSWQFVYVWFEAFIFTAFYSFPRSPRLTSLTSSWLLLV